MSSPSTTLSDFVLEHLPSVDVARQAELYRAMAAVEPSREEKRRLEALALTCDREIATRARRARLHAALVRSHYARKARK